MLEIQNLHVLRGKAVVLHDISITIPSGGSVGVFGANGAGKTTLVRTIAGFMPTAKGRIRFQSFESERALELTRLRPYQIARLGILQVPERCALFNDLSVKENLLLGASYGETFRYHQQSIDMVFTLFPRLMERQRQMAGRLSGGEQQMLAIAKALMGRPRLLVLDEPSLGLAPAVALQVYHKIKGLRSDMGLSLLISEQNVSHALTLCETVYVLKNGNMMWHGPAQDLLAQDVGKWYLGL